MKEQSGATKVGSAKRIIRRNIASTSLNSELSISVESNNIYLKKFDQHSCLMVPIHQERCI